MPIHHRYDTAALEDEPEEREARRLILPPEAGMSTDLRWELETADIVERLRPTAERLLRGDCSERRPRWIDYGCGIGRIAKPLVEDLGQAVVGLDTSGAMLRLALRYVNHRSFRALEPETIDHVVDQEGLFEAACAIRVLQHAYDRGRALRRIAQALAPGAPFFVLTAHSWAAPADRLADLDGLVRNAGFELADRQDLRAPLFAEGAHWSEWRRA